MDEVKRMKKAFLIILLIVGATLGAHVLAQGWSFSCPGGDCLKAGVNAAGNTIGKSSGVITGKGIVQSAQDLIIYFLSFISLIAVIYIMWAGAQMLLAPQSEESSEKTKKIIISVIVGIAIIWFAWWIVSTLFYFLNNRAVVSDVWVPRAVAETQIRNVDFTTYSNKIRAQKTRITSAYSPEVTRELGILIDGAYDHLPDRADQYVNRQLYDRVKKALSEYDLHREEIDRGILENAINAFLEQVQPFVIEGQIAATPRNGDAPLSVTLEGKNIIDTSGTLIPENNFTWWLRTADGPRVIGRDKTINYVFEEEGTYTVYLTVNSASKNSRGFTDVISFEESTTVEVGQPKLKLVVYFNDQLASNTVKIPTRESTQKILIDATQSTFASGYTITKTEWDFGNAKTLVREGPPIVEAQNYHEGEFSVKVTFTRNDGEIFTRSILLKVGDPIASISSSNYAPNKGDPVVFQAKKVTQEGVQYSWEIRKFGVEQPIFVGTGPRIEYSFRDIGRYSVSLISSKGDIRDKESLDVSIESRAPVVRFTGDQIGPETPNIYVFDGTSTYDPDYPDDQSLRYQWFINDKPTELMNTNSENSRGEYIFPEIGVYDVELQVTDEQGKISRFKKNITIKSLLSIILNIRPQVVQRKQNIIFSASAPNAQIYEWSIGSKDVAVTESGRFVTNFDITGTYPLTLKVTDKDGNTNSIQRKIYVVDGESPLAIMQLSTKSLFTELQPNACNGQEALVADRVTPVSLVGDKSVNVGGKTTDLTYFWKVGLNATSSQKNFTYTFDELGCEEITLIVTDKKTGASHVSKEWVKVVNIPPRFSDIEVLIENIDQDPMRINLRMEGAKDPDGVIRSYTWYYYTNTDEQPQGFRITTRPETSFTLPKINGRYHFSVVLEDANGLRVDTRDISESKFSTPDLLVNQNIATPLIEFRSSAHDVKYGDPVELSVTTKNALGQDITKAVDYRWDVDGDGFYDVKTAENILTYKYTVPGEYHPKVKVSHRGLSTTKFLTINVTNRLIPQAQIQVIGDKIIAYNTSTGIVQSVTWFADDTKVSENKDYLIYSPEGGTFPKTLKLVISDGTDTQSVTIPIERNPQNKVLVRKIPRPLVILTNDTGDMTPAPDDIIWSDPLKPLFFYLGESQGQIQYYIIDNDIDIDTDLSGGKNDDADNRGTASYRLGRPYKIPVGTKRVTIMRMRLLGADGSELDSRQIRVTRSFMAQVIDAENPVTAGPQTFNLSEEDKGRLDRLTTLISGITDVTIKNDLSRYTEQLGDIWYDRTDRAETLLQLSHAIETAAEIPVDLKTRIQDQINLIYTQGQEDAQDKDLARLIISDFLSRSSAKVAIFGDGGSNEGLMNQIIDNPEYYEQNRKIVDKIYEEYVQFDPDLSDDAKSIIHEKLLFIAGTPAVEPLVPTANDQEPGTSTLSGNLTKILLWIFVALVGIFGALFVWKKIGSKTPFLKGDENSVKNEGDLFNNKSSVTPEAGQLLQEGAHTPDWLRESESPFGSVDVLSQDEPVKETHTDTETLTPSWMSDQHDEVDPVEQVTPVNQVNQVNPINETDPETGLTGLNGVNGAHNSVPDWLRDDTSIPSPIAATEVPSVPSSSPSDALPSESSDLIKAGEEGVNLTPSSSERGDLMTGEVTGKKEEPMTNDQGPITANTAEDIPDWLRGSEVSDVNPVDETDTGTRLTGLNPINGVVAESNSMHNEKAVNPLFESEAPVAEKETNIEHGTLNIEHGNDDIPDWLKGADSPSSSGEVNPPGEENEARGSRTDTTQSEPLNVEKETDNSPGFPLHLDPNLRYSEGICHSSPTREGRAHKRTSGKQWKAGKEKNEKVNPVNQVNPVDETDTGTGLTGLNRINGDTKKLTTKNKKPKKKPTTKTKSIVANSKLKTQNGKLLSEGDHLIGPAKDLLGDASLLIGNEDNTRKK